MSLTILPSAPTNRNIEPMGRALIYALPININVEFDALLRAIDAADILHAAPVPVVAL